MNTPILDFIREYNARNVVRMHMPGHKGAAHLGCESMDITEVSGADVLYHAKGIIAESKTYAARIFGAARTLYSTEGSSLAIRAMLWLVVKNARSHGKRQAHILAGRNAHKSFITAAGLLDIKVTWMYGSAGSDIVSCRLSAAEVEAYLKDNEADAVYITSPDYLGNMTNIEAIAKVCHKYNCMLLVDNAHGTYLALEGRHPMMLGADLCCDSAHKTLPVLTGGAYLHISSDAPSLCREYAEEAMSLFASTSPSYLILASLDAANKGLTGEIAERLPHLVKKINSLKEKLAIQGFELAGDESIKLTLRPKSYGYTGTELADILREHSIEPEFCDPDYLVLMFSTDTKDEDIEQLIRVLVDIEKRPAISVKPPAPHPARQMMSIGEALLAESEEVPVKAAVGRISADINTACPPAVPITVCGELIDEHAVECLKYYGIETVRVVK